MMLVVFECAVYAFLNFLEFPKVVGLGYKYLFLGINSLFRLYLL